MVARPVYAGPVPTTRMQWVFLAYRLPREPSTPRITVWRKLRRLGAAQLLDGLVALPADARTKEQFEWLADEILEAGGDASLWLAEASTGASSAISSTNSASEPRMSTGPSWTSSKASTVT